MRSGKRWILGGALLLAALLTVVGLAGCGNSSTTSDQNLTGKVSLSGSTTVLPPASEAASQFMDIHPGVQVSVQGGGSSVGITQLSQGLVDIGMSSRELKSEEQNQGFLDHKIALDVIVVVANPGMTVDDLTKDQVKGIFTGQLTNWKDVGGADAPITVVVRDKASGTREMFDEKALDSQDSTTAAIEANSNGIVRQTVASTRNAIGYISLGYLDGTVKALKYNSVEGSKDTALAKTYPLSRFLHMFTKGEPQGVVGVFIDFVLSERFQNDVVAREYIPATEL